MHSYENIKIKYYAWQHWPTESKRRDRRNHADFSSRGLIMDRCTPLYIYNARNMWLFLIMSPTRSERTLFLSLFFLSSFFLPPWKATNIKIPNVLIYWYAKGYSGPVSARIDRSHGSGGIIVDQCYYVRFLSLACLTFASMQVQSCVANVYDQRVCICSCSLLLRARLAEQHPDCFFFLFLLVSYMLIYVIYIYLFSYSFSFLLLSVHEGKKPSLSHVVRGCASDWSRETFPKKEKKKIKTLHRHAGGSGK